MLSILSQIRFPAWTRVISGAITPMSNVFVLRHRPDTLCWGNHNTPILVIDTPHKAFWDAMFSQEEKGEQFCFCKWKTNGAGWKIAEEWNGIATFVVPCQPQGRIPGIRIPHSGTNVLFQWQHILVLSLLPSLKIGLLKCFSDSHWQILSLVLTLTRSFAIFLHFSPQK